MMKRKLKNAIMISASLILFSFLVWQLFIHVTYLFRNTDGDGRQRILAFQEEKSNSLDVVFVGGSNIHRFWDTMLAWDQYGMATFGYSSATMSAYTYLPAIQEVQRSQTPVVMVVDVRRYLSKFPDNNVRDIDYRNMIDSMDYDLNRLLAEKYVCELNQTGITDALSCYIDIIQYHSNRNALKDQEHWYLANNDIPLNRLTKNLYKGSFPDVSSHSFLPRPENRSTQTCKLPEKAETAYREMIEYCVNRQINLLLIESPFEESEQDSMELNTMAEIAEEYNIEFLDLNDYYDEMGLDFSTDFYDINHTNTLGMEKYTTFLAGVLKEKYDIPDHRGEELYSEWDELYEDYKVIKENAVKAAWKAIEGKKQALEDEETMRQTNDAYEWLSRANNPNMTVLSIKSGSLGETSSTIGTYFLETFGISTDVLTNGQDQYGVFCAKKINQYGTEGNCAQQIVTGYSSLSYKVGVDGGDSYIIIGDKDYYIENDGIQFVVIDNNTLEVADSIVISLNHNGEFDLRHIIR